MCGHDFTVNHAMNCASGGFPTHCVYLGISPQLRCLRFVMMWRLSQCCNPYLASIHFAMANVEDEVFVCKDSRETVIS